MFVTGQGYVGRMVVLGIAVSGSDSVARCIILDPQGPDFKLTDRRELSYKGKEQPILLFDMSKALRTLLKEIQPSCVVIRQADQSRNAPRAGGLSRLMAEGALAAAAAGVEPNTRLLTGAQCARVLDMTKEDALNSAKAGAKAAGLTQVWADAILAARAAELQPSQ